MKQKASKFLIFCDYLRQPYEFKLKYDQRNGTPLGGIFSLFFGAILIFYFASSYIQLEQQGNKVQDDDRKFITNIDNITEKDVYFSLRFRTQNSKGEYTHYNLSELQSYLEIEAFEIIENEGLNITKITIADCSDSKIYLNSQSWLQKPLTTQDFPKLICALGKFSLSGYEDTENNSYLRIVIRKCQQQGLKCNSSLDDFLARLQVSVVFVSNNLDLDLETGEFIRANFTTIVSQRMFGQPIDLSCYISLTKLGLKEKSLYTVLMGGDEFREIARGVHLLTWQKQFLAGDYILESLGYPIQDSLIQINIRIDPEIHSQFAERTDMVIKIFDALSLFGGLFTTFFTFLSLIYKFYQRHRIYQHLMNQNLIFDLGKLQTTRLKPRQTTNFLLKNFSYQVSFSYPSYIYLNCKQFFMKLFKIQLKDDKDLQVFQEAQTLLKRELDLTHILEKLLEVDKLKLLLMDDHQLCLFNSLAKPTIQIEANPFEFKRKQSLYNQRSSVDFSKIISFNQGFFRSKKIINDGPTILEKYFEIMEGSNSYSDINKKFLELLKMNKKLYRILEVQYKLSRSFQSKWKIQNYGNDDQSGKVKFQRCVCKILIQKKNGTLGYFLQELDKQNIMTRTNKSFQDGQLLHDEQSELKEQIHFNMPNIQAVIFSRKSKKRQKMIQSKRTFINQKRDSIGDY